MFAPKCLGKGTKGTNREDYTILLLPGQGLFTRERQRLLYIFICIFIGFYWIFCVSASKTFLIFIL